MPTDRTKVNRPAPPRLVFGEDRTCWKCKGKGRVTDGGRTNDCAYCGGTGFTHTRGPEPEKDHR